MRLAANRARMFLQAADYPLGTALVTYHFGGGLAGEVVTALGHYQNTDGGFGNGLEVDIAAPASNPFATRLAIQVLRSLREPPTGSVVDGLRAWLAKAQHDDGDWHFAPEIYDADLAPWFAGWTFPSLNPAGCLVGLGTAIGVIEPQTAQRTATLFDRLASIDEARTADFYTLLPYVEYFDGFDHPQRDAYLDAIAANITATQAEGRYADVPHFLDHALGGSPDLLQRLDFTQLNSAIDAVLNQQEDDGGWPNEYSAAWRPWATTALVFSLASLRSNQGA